MIIRMYVKYGLIASPGLTQTKPKATADKTTNQKFFCTKDILIKNLLFFIHNKNYCITELFHLQKHYDLIIVLLLWDAWHCGPDGNRTHNSSMPWTCNSRFTTGPLILSLPPRACLPVGGETRWGCHAFYHSHIDGNLNSEIIIK